MADSGLYRDAVGLLRELVSVPSFSREESATAGIIVRFLEEHGVRDVKRQGNNVWAYNLYFDPSKPTLLLNSHHDTVRPNDAYTRDPYSPDTEEGRLYGLGSNDAGGSLVALTAVFRTFYERCDLKYNLCLALTAEEEISGANGIASILPELINLDFAIVGEPTSMQLAVAEKGLVVLDCTAHGKSGHAAREEGDNAIYRAMKDIEWFRTYRFPRKSDLFGDVKMTVSMISAGTQHNVVPAECRFVVDVRVTERYGNQEVVEIIRKHVDCDVEPRSLRLKPSSTDMSHPVVRAGLEAGLGTYGSPTTSDQVHLHIPSVKIGPGESARSHSADEYILLDEIERGIDIYTEILEKVITE